MEQFLRDIQSLSPDQLQYEAFGQWLQSRPWDNLQYDHLIPADLDDSRYCRINLALEPMEVTLVCWPAGQWSSVHHHQGFWGYVCVLEGRGHNIEYDWQGDTVRQLDAWDLKPGDCLDEKEGVVHKLGNPDGEKRMVTLHLYVPPLRNFAGMKIFDLEKKRLGIFNEKATTFSWKESPDHFEQIVENAFTVE